MQAEPQGIRLILLFKTAHKDLVFFASVDTREVCDLGRNCANYIGPLTLTLDSRPQNYEKSMPVVYKPPGCCCFGIAAHTD